MVDTITKLLLLLSPIVYGTRINLDKLDLRFFQVGVIALFIASFFDTIKRDIPKDIKIIGASLAGLVILNSFWHRFQPMDIRAVEDLFFGILGIYIMTRYLKDPQGCIKYILWALVINIIVLIFQRLNYAPLISLPHYIPDDIELEGGMLGNITRFGIYLALILPFVYLPMALVLAFTFGYYLHYAQISVFIPIAVMLFFRIKQKVYRYIFAASLIIPALFLYKKILASILMRWEIWKPIIDMIFERPLLGWGFGTYQLLIGTESFNSYLPFAYGLGILGIVWIGFMACWFIKNFYTSKEAMAVTGLLLVSLIEYAFDLPRLWLTIMFIISFFVIGTIKKEAVDGDN